MKEIKNFAKVRFMAKSENESFARIFTSGFVMNLGITPSQLADIKTVVSEAVTNSIVHGYQNKEKTDGKINYVFLELKFDSTRTLTVTVSDRGKGIENIEKAMEPFFTTDREGERSGMGLPIMDAFSDSMRITSRPGLTKVVMKRRFK